jgi:omega-6 fatty acid desaturase (delta-12 desaturase)
MLTFTPYYHWRWQHSIHHGAAGDLDRRGVGDIWTLTVQEYLESSRWKRFAYRLARNPVVLFVIAPLVLFVGWQRFPSPRASRRERHSVWAMNLAVLGMAAALSMIFGVVPYLVIQFTAMVVAGSAGVWLFYVQHQFEVLSTSCRESCSGSLGTSGFITSIISVRGFPTTTSKNATGPTRCSTT